MFELIHFVAFGVALVVCAASTRWVRDFSNARGWNAIPSSERHIHTRRIPRLGGVAIFLTLWGIGLLAWTAGHFGAFGFVFPPMIFKILGPATIIFVVGLIDDFRGLGPYVKLAAQGGAAMLLYCTGFGISRLSLRASHPQLGWAVGLPLTVLWVVWITNAFNLIDGLDGLAAGCALLSTLVTCVAAVCFHNEGILFVSIALAGAIAGFLRYNFNPASIFLGDSGSLLIGFLLSALALAGSQKAPTVAAVAIPLVSLGLPIVDVTVAVLRRFLSCRGLFHADREHIHHRLLERGISHRQVVLLLYGVSACFGLLSLSLLHPAGALIFTELIIIGTGVFFGLQQLGYLEFLELGRVAARAMNQRRVIANDLNIWRAPDALRSCTSLSEFCKILQCCLEPAGIDGFGLYLDSELPAKPQIYPIKYAGYNPKLWFFWNRSRLSETNWSMSFGLTDSSGERLGNFSLYRKDASSPVLLDLEVFTATGFSDAVAEVVQKMRSSWFMKRNREGSQKGGLGKGAPLVPTPVSRTREAPSSGYFPSQN